MKSIQMRSKSQKGDKKSTKPLKFRNEILVISRGLVRNASCFVFSYETIFCSTKHQKDFVIKSFSRWHTRRTFKDFEDFFILFLKIWTHLEIFRRLRNFLWGFGKTLFVRLNCPIH